MKGCPRTFMLLLTLVLLLSLGSARAQGPVVPQAPLTSAFSYQGYLTEGGVPANGLYDFQFKLFDAGTGGSQVGPTRIVEDVSVVDGRFTVLLSFGDVFDGTALWLEVAVRPGASTGAFTSLSPRQFLSPVPYASYALRIPLGGSGTSATAARSDHDHLGQSWSGATAVGLRIETSDSSGNAVIGVATATNGINYGVVGQSASFQGSGVVGYSTAITGSTAGVLGQSQSSQGSGVLGIANAITGTTYGVYGKSVSPMGAGVFGLATSVDGFAYGVMGVSQSTIGRGVYGLANASTGFTRGVVGASYSSQGSGVVGVAIATIGRTFGVAGHSESPDGVGIYGENISTGFAAYFTATEVFSDTVDGHIVVIENPGVSGPNDPNGPDGLALVLSGVVTPTGTSNFISFFRADGPDPDSDPDPAGRIEGNGAGGVTYQTSGADFAEMLPAVPGLEPGDVLAIGPDGRLVRADVPYQTNVLGVYSAAPGFLGDRSGPQDNGEVPVAFLGVVPVKASAENGPIHPGDLLVASSTPGHAMRAGPNPPPGSVLGKALEPLEAGTGTILMAVLLH